jgi:hypothetical protein
MKSSHSEFDEHHKRKVVMCAPGSSPRFPSNFGISEGNLVSVGANADHDKLGH